MDKIERNGRTFKVTIDRDDMGPPWEEHDGHGPVSDWTTRDKRPGEMVLHQDGRSRRYYDFAGAVVLARKDGWDTEPYNTGTAKSERNVSRSASPKAIS